MKIIKPVNAAAPLTAVQLKKILVKYRSGLMDVTRQLEGSSHPQEKAAYIGMNARLEVVDAIVDAI